METEFIERRICTGLIVSTDYLRKVFPIINLRYFQSPTAKLLAQWCVEFFEKYDRAPGRDIEGIYIQKVREGLKEEQAEWIEMVLEGLSQDYERADSFNADYLLDETKSYFRQRHLELFTKELKATIESGDVSKAEALAMGYRPSLAEKGSYLDVFSQNALVVVEDAFRERQKPLIKFPKALGEFWNHELHRGAFVAFMGREKIGKTFWLIEMAMRAIRSGCNVVFFQAGDMTEKQQIRRIAIYLAGKSDREAYCQEMWVPEVDCVKNLLDQCNKPEREPNEQVFERVADINYETLIQAVESHPNHVPCRNCSELVGTVWLKKRPATKPLTWVEGYKAMRRFGRKYKRKFRLCTYANETLSVTEIKNLLWKWEKEEGFVADVIVIDYADILAPCPDFRHLDFRNQQNRIWQRLRNLSEEKHVLVITATQAKATAYSKADGLLDLSDYSEDKRKYAHVTAMYGLNQSADEKQIGIMRINELLVRDSDFNSNRPIKVLQRLQIGRPFLGSYF